MDWTGREVYCLAALAIVGFRLLLMTLWNALVPAIFLGPVITFWQCNWPVGTNPVAVFRLPAPGWLPSAPETLAKTLGSKNGITNLPEEREKLARLRETPWRYWNWDVTGSQPNRTNRNRNRCELIIGEVDCGYLLVKPQRRTVRSSTLGKRLSEFDEQRLPETTYAFEQNTVAAQILVCFTSVLLLIVPLRIMGIERRLPKELPHLGPLLDHTNAAFQSHIQERVFALFILHYFSKPDLPDQFI